MTEGSSSSDQAPLVEPEVREASIHDHVVADCPRCLDLAYSPCCAFSDTFSCLLLSEENWLETTVEAGKKAY